MPFSDATNELYLFNFFPHAFHFLNEYLSTRDLGSYSFKLVLILKVDISLLLLSILIILPGKIYMYKNGVENGRKTFQISDLLSLEWGNIHHKMGQTISKFYFLVWKIKERYFQKNLSFFTIFLYISLPNNTIIQSISFKLENFKQIGVCVCIYIVFWADP